ncbi:MAG: WG repeat-containing protein [Saprospiraceae bacterium]|nr:WG repeat-containing protein [Candidatus Brachybacter algidus]
MIKNQNYRIVQLGVGKYTKVYCMELDTDKKVAVKVLKPEYERNKFFQDQLIKEARIGMQIKHASVRKVLDIIHNDEDNTYQIMMEYLEGYNMQEYIQNFGSIPENQVAEWLKSIIPALIETHRKGIVHGLLKPGNLIIDPKGKLKICDFKGAYFESELFPENVDADDILFLSPEQIQHIGPISQSSDIYTLGVTIYTLLSGRDPYDAKNADVDEIRLRILNEPLPFVEKASLKLNSIIQAATAKNPKERFPLLESMLEELDGGEFRKKDQLTEDDLFSVDKEALMTNIEDLSISGKVDDPKTDNIAPKKIKPFPTARPINALIKEDDQTDKISEGANLISDPGQPSLELNETSDLKNSDNIKADKIEDETLSVSTVIVTENDESKSGVISLEDRAQAVWDRLGVTKSDTEPTVSKVSVVKTTNIRIEKNDKKIVSDSPTRSDLNPVIEKPEPFILIEKQDGDKEINNGDKSKDIGDKIEPVHKPELIEDKVSSATENKPVEKNALPASDLLQDKANKIVVRPIPISNKPKEKEFAIEGDNIEQDQTIGKKNKWFLPSLLVIGFLVGGYFLYDALIKSQKNDIVITQIDTPTIEKAEINENLAQEINSIEVATADSLISADSTLNLEDLEKAKLAKIKELEALKKKRQEEKEKEAANAVDLSKIEILSPYIGLIAPYRYKNLIGFISKEGKIIVKPKYNDILNFNNGLAPVNENGKWGFVNTSGEEVIKPKYNEIFGFSKGLAGVKKDGKWGFIGSTGNTVVPFNYDVVTDFADGLAGVRKNGKWGFVNKKGVEAIACQFDNAWSFKDGLAGVEKNNKWGFINKSGVSVIDLKYGQVNNFIEGFACVEKNGKYGFINKEGVEVISCEYEAAKPFKNGTARVFYQGKWIYINKSGKCVRDCN